MPHHRLDVGVPRGREPSLQVLEGASVGDVKDQNGSVPAASQTMTGWWYTYPAAKILANWDDHSQYMET